MWKGVFSALTTKFHADETIDFREMERCIKLQIDSGISGFVLNSAIGEGSSLVLEERMELLRLTKSLCGKLPVLFSICEYGTREAENVARMAAKSHAAGLIIDPMITHKITTAEAASAYNDISRAGDIPTFISIETLGCHAKGIELLKQLEQNPLIVGLCNDATEVRHLTTFINTFDDRFLLFTSRDTLAFESLSVGATGWISGMSGAFSKEITAIYRLLHAQRSREALELYRWLRPLLDLTETKTRVQNIKLAELLTIQSTEFMRRPRKMLPSEIRLSHEELIKQCLLKRQEWSND